VRYFGAVTVVPVSFILRREWGGKKQGKPCDDQCSFHRFEFLLCIGRPTVQNVSRRFRRPSPVARYSDLIASTGSIRVARQAGTRVATIALAPSSAAIPAKVAGSPGWVS